MVPDTVQLMVRGGGLVFPGPGVRDDAPGRDRPVPQRPQELPVPVLAQGLRGLDLGQRAGDALVGVVDGPIDGRPVLLLQAVFRVPHVQRRRLIRHLQGVVRNELHRGLSHHSSPMEPRLVGHCAQLVAGLPAPAEVSLPRRREAKVLGIEASSQPRTVRNTIYSVHVKIATPYSVAGSLLPSDSPGAAMRRHGARLPIVPCGSLADPIKLRGDGAWSSRPWRLASCRRTMLQ